jgi:peptidoglycan/LPS O-acetylase OafA/YrhL
MFWPLVIYIVNPKYIGKLIFVFIILIFILKYNMLTSGLSINKFIVTRVDQLMMGSYLAILEFKGFFDKKNSLKKTVTLGLLVLPIWGISLLF